MTTSHSRRLPDRYVTAIACQSTKGGGSIRARSGRTEVLLTLPRVSPAAAHRLADDDSVIARIAADLVARIRQLTIDINRLRDELDARTAVTAPNLRKVHGISVLASAKLVGEDAGVNGSGRVTPSPGTTAPHPPPCGPATTAATASAAPATVSSTPSSTAPH